MIAIYHIAEWLRATLLLLISCVGTNLTIIWYVTMLNSIYGLVAYVFLYVVYFSTEGQACAQAQTFRAQFMLAEVICFWVLFLPMIYPLFVLFICSKQSHEKILAKKAAEDEDDE